MPEVLFPVLTGLTLVFAGILVGYFLWFRDRSEQLILCENLSTEKERLTAELRAKSAQCSELDEKSSRLGIKNTSLEQLCDDLMSSREKIQLQANDLESELHSSRNKLDKMRDQLTDECRKRAKTEETLLVAKQQFVDSLAQTEGNWKDRFANTESSLAKKSSELTRFATTNEQLTERLHAANSEIAELKSELNAQREILETAKTNAVGLEKEYVTLETSMRSQIELLNEARGQTAAAISAKDLAEVGLNEHRTQVRDLQGRISELESDVRESEKISARCEHLESSLELSNERMESVVAQRDNAIDQAKLLEEELTGLRMRSDNQQVAIQKLRSEGQEEGERRRQQYEGLQNQVQLMEKANSDLLAECGQLTQRVAESEEEKLRNGESLQLFSQENGELVAKLAKREAAHMEISRIAEDHNQRIESLIEQRDRTSEELEDLRATIARLQEEVEQREQYGMETTKLAEEYQLRIESILQQRDRAHDEIEELQVKIRRMRQLAKSNEETIRGLRRERGVVLMRNREMNASFPRIHAESIPFAPAQTQQQTKEEQLVSEYGGKIETDPVRGQVFVEAPDERDDLKRIYGVAVVLETRLNEYGIYTFKQIMNWDEKAIEEFSELLSFKDRIHRDGWLAQATKLYEQKTEGNQELRRAA